MQHLRGFWSFVSPVITDADGLLSIGRISFWSTFLSIHYHWFEARDVPESMLTILMALMAYELVKKGRDVAREVVGASNTDLDADIFGGGK